ncbi:hypothetical protein NX794_26670 [Streptomyces sp. LP11]|uniref:Integral membrane protein n=1 Tax=Streptomyces pyxinicus TaxID=2970331 RepID=A0ABT2B8I6_9ACTN|nr:hypothetical protein [Streptomyces sp. LP11]MCS0604772.1 hypothetical protein [Streptomyces sp. LP11]
MSTAHVPRQAQSTPAAPPSSAPPPSTPPHASEATRLLCAGTYLDPGYRDRVIEELHLNEQRFAAPSFGLDAARVLAHALRARRQELQWSGAVLGLWLVGFALAGRALTVYLFPGVYLLIGAWLRGRTPEVPQYRLVLAFLFRWWGRIVLAVLLAVTLFTAFGGGPDDTSSSSSPYGSDSDPYASDSPTTGDALRLAGDALGAGVKPWQAWATLVLFALIALCLAGQREQLARVITGELSGERFPDAAADPAERGESRRFQWLKQRIRTEQHVPLIMYHEARPFCGAGAAHEDWVLAVELKPDPLKKQQPIGNRLVLEKIRPLVERLRLPAEYAGPGVRDRLRWLAVDECVFLPAEGLLRRESAPYDRDAFEQHRSHAVEEGAEKRRHFLRIRVSGWEEELVVTVFVRIHTQGRMLVLEVIPHVLLPVREDFKDADRIAHRFRGNSLFGKAAWAVGGVPRSPVRSLVVVCKAAVYGWRLLTGGYANALPDGPALSVRELGAAAAASQFQEMDVSRYLKSIQDRVANGVRAALAEAGYQTGEFIQQINHISNGGVHIGRVEGSTFAVGDHSSASSASSASSSVNGGSAPQKGSDAHGDE